MSRKYRWKFLKIMVAPGRVELPTFGLGNRCSIHLSYGAIVCLHQFTLCGVSLAGLGLYMRRRPDLVAASHHAFSRTEHGCRSAASCSSRSAEGRAWITMSSMPSAFKLLASPRQ
jgi:hypothetical protein